MTPDPDYDLSDPGLWTTNHGNFLLIFVGIIFLIGGGILFYQQNLMFQRPRFPDSDNIQTVMTNDASRLGTVLIRILGAANDKGTMKIAIYGAEYTLGTLYSDTADKTLEFPPRGRCSWEEYQYDRIPKR